MSNKVHFQTVPPSVESVLIQLVMGLLGMKRRMEKKIINDGYCKEPASIPKSILKGCNIQIDKHRGRNIWTISQKNIESDFIILYLHGGAYYANITIQHWRFIEQLLVCTKARFVIPDYPLAPEATCNDIYSFIDAVYEKLICIYPSKQIVFMGDSAGGGLALGFAQKIRKESIKQPSQIILFSPWLDVSMTNPEIDEFDKRDKILSINGLKLAGKKYAGDLNVTDFRVSPIYGDFSNLARISVFIGTNEVFIADARKLKQLLEEQHIEFNYFEYTNMFHDWVVVPNLKETKDVIRTIATYLNPMNR